MYGFHSKGQRRWTNVFLQGVWLLVAASPEVLGYFLGNTKAVLNGCKDHWTLQDSASMPLLFQMTVCVDVRVVVPGTWVAFSYSSVHAPRPELGLEGDEEALYGWLLRVRHRFPFRLSLGDWHRVCLRRDVQRNSFSLEVDGQQVSARTVIAQAIPPSGSLRLGCRPRDLRPGAALGSVELYLFRVWADLNDHDPCEDGTVIGWNALHWGLTSPRARQWDPSLQCGVTEIHHKRQRRYTNTLRKIFFALFGRGPWNLAEVNEVRSPSAPSGPVRASKQVTGSSLAECYIRQLCSHEDAFYWMSLRVEVEGGSQTEEYVRNQVSGVLGCPNPAGSMEFCQDDRSLQVEQLTCRKKGNIGKTACHVVLKLGHAVPACELQRAVASALQHAGDEGSRATLVGDVERVARDVCGDSAPSPGRFVRCTTSSSLDDICQDHNHQDLTCSVIEANSRPAPQPGKGSCSRVAPGCNCTAFCGSASRFYGIKINIHLVSVHYLEEQLSHIFRGDKCTPRPECREILKLYKDFHVGCHRISHGFRPCTVIVETAGPVDSCTLKQMMQSLIESNENFTSERPLAPIAVCGSPEAPNRGALKPSQTWESRMSDICQRGDTLLLCDANQRLVLLNDSCPPATQQSTVQPVTPSRSLVSAAPVTSAPSVTATAEQTAETTVALQHPNATRETAHSVTSASSLTAISSTPSPTAQPVLQTDSPNASVILSNGASTPTKTTALLITAAPSQNTTAVTTISPVNLTTVAQIESMINTTTMPPREAIASTITPIEHNINVYNMTTTGTTQYNLTTSDPETTHATVATSTQTPNETVEYNVTTAMKNYTTALKNNMSEYNVTKASETQYNIATMSDHIRRHNSTNETTNTTAVPFTQTPNETVEYNVTTAKNDTTALKNNMSEYNVTTADINRNSNEDIVTTRNGTDNIFTAPYPTLVYNVTTAANSSTAEYNISRVTYSHNNTTEFYATTTDAHTTSPHHAELYNASIGTNNNATKYNTTTVTFPSITTRHNVTETDNARNPHNENITAVNTTMNIFTDSSPLNYTSVTGATTDTNSYKPPYNITANNNRTQSSLMSNTTLSTFTPSPDYNTTAVNAFAPTDSHTAVNRKTTETNTTVSNNYTRQYNTTAAQSQIQGTISSNVLIHTVTAFPNYTTADNMTTAAKIQNKTTTEVVTMLPVSKAQQGTTTPAENTTGSTAASKLDSQTNTTFPVNSTLPSLTSADGIIRKSITSRLHSQTGKQIAPSTQDIKANSQSTGLPPHLSSKAKGRVVSSTTTMINPTTQPVLTTLIITTTTQPVVTTLTTATQPVATTPTLPYALDPPFAIQKMEVLPTTSSATTLQTTEVTSIITTKAETGSPPTSTAETTAGQDALEEQANELLDQTQEMSQLNSSQVEQLTGQLEKLLEGPSVSQAVGQKAVAMISNLMEGDSLTLSMSANRLLQAVDDLGVKLVVTSDVEVVSSKSLVLAVKKVDLTDFPSTSVVIFDTDNIQFRTFNRFSRSSSGLGSVSLPSSLTAALSSEQQQQAHRIQFTFYTKSALFQDAALNNQTLVSPVLGCSVANLSISNLAENIQFTIRHPNPKHKKVEPLCAFWDFTLNGGGGGWSAAGCFLASATAEDATCSCNHLTSFAILLDLSRDNNKTDPQQAQTLSIITNIGCAISAIFLSITLLTYLSFEKLLRDTPAKILVQLCASLLFLNLVFLLDGWLALHPVSGLCISTAFFLHYFLLTSFTWAGLEALHMYLSVVQVFTPYLSRYMLKFSLMGWGQVCLNNIPIIAGFPLVVVIVVLSVDKDNYGLVTYGKHSDGTSDKFCWLRNDIAFYVAVVAYFILIFALSLLVFIMVMVQLARIKKQNPQNQSPNRGVLTDLRSIVGLVILLGLTWGFILFAWGPLHTPFVYLFTILNSLQGFLVFLFHCAVKENVRRQWRTHLCCGRLRLAENSEWSRMATQYNKSMVIATTTTSAPNFTSWSSSVVSDGTNSSGSVFADSGISDGCSNDVILNEIHRQNLTL